MHRIIIFSVLLSSALLFGQEKSIPVNFSLFNESTAVPFTRFITVPVHPGIQIGTEFNYKNKEFSRLFQAVNIGFFYHNFLALGVGLNTELGYEYRLKPGLAFTGLLGVGYMHTFATTEEFTFTNGQYTKKTDKGNARLYPSLAIDAGYYLKKNSSTGPKIFLRYQAWAEYPYSPGFIPVMTHINLHVGAKFFIHTKSKNYE
ncbi:MAG: hypothetical protein JXB24_06995 [Bacteroidales bacterium]|nr:hypothetical protein [Bacteroidales bacterium]